VTARIQVGGTPADGTIGPDGLVWIPDLATNLIRRIDPATNRTADSIPVGRSPFVLSVGYGDVWAPAYGGTSVWRLRVGWSSRAKRSAVTAVGSPPGEWSSASPFANRQYVSTPRPRTVSAARASASSS